MTQDIFIGVDGGATTSKVRVEDSTGHVLGQTVGGPANIRLSVEEAWESIYSALNEVFDPLNISLQDNDIQFHAGFGLAGCEVQEAYRHFLSMPHPFTTLRLISDAHIACFGAHSGKDGAIIIVGTGVVGYRMKGGEGVRVGGWGFPHDDVGGGAWLGLEALRLTFQWLDKRVEKSPLAEDVFAFFNHDLNRFVTWANRANSSELARLAPLVINHGLEEEMTALRLIKKAAHEVDRIDAALTKIGEDDNERLPCSLFGGIAPFIEPWLSEELRARLVKREADASSGAILMIRQAR